MTEVGEKTENSGSAIKFIAIFGTSVSDYYNPKMINDTRYEAWIDGAGNRKEVTRTYYSNEDLTSLPSEYIINPSTARNRITSVTYAETWTLDDNQYDHATHYMYDIHGNVNTLFQDNKKLATEIPTLATEQIKRIDYRYDLISGNVHRVSVQAGKADQWHHAYLYDADNRIEAAYTNSSTPTLSLKASSAALQNELVMNADWENDARYFYYDHGPLSRVELGEENIQGMDYVYNLQGWLKGVNSSFLHTNKDPGADGAFASAFPRDVMSFSLNYFNTDYAPIDGNKAGANSFHASITGSAAESNSFELFNGNIRAMQTTIMNPTTGEILPMITGYKYDQLQRLKEARSFTAHDENKWLPEVYNNRYYNEFSYDANGNINSQIRHDHSGNQIDNLTYKYHQNAQNERIRNRLYHVLDVVDNDAYLDDIDKQKSLFEDTDPTLKGTFVEKDKLNAVGGVFKINGSNNYVYDAEGRLIRDLQEQLKISWRVDGKIKEIRDLSNVLKVSFQYDAMGNRVAKSSFTGGLLDKTTIYILDAQGNTMNVYERNVDNVNHTTSYSLEERHIYGSSRIGILTQEVTSVTGAVSKTFQEGDKYYEMNNHLNSVLTVVADKRKPLSTFGGTTVTGYQAYISSSGDYSPFGVQLLDRTFESSKYRYSFQNQEHDDEIKGDGNSINYQYRMHDPRLGRFFAIDPLSAEYPWNSPYAFSENRVTNAVEIEGLEAEDKNSAAGSQRKDGSFNGWHLIPEVNAPAGQPAVIAKPLTITEKPLMTSYAEGFKAGAEATIQSVTETPSFLETLINVGTMGSWDNLKQIAGITQALSKVPDYTANDYVYGGGFLTEKLFEAVILRKCSIRFKLNFKIPVATEEVVGKGGLAELSSLNPTHYITKSESGMKRFVSGVKIDGAINQSILFVEHNGSKFIVDGHHRFFAAQKVGIQNVPVQQIQLPFRGYQTTSDLILSGKQPGWWKFYKP